MKGEVKERGMIFNDEMVRAILEGRKTQTRRIMKNQPAEVGPEAPVMVREIGAGFQWYGADGVSSVFNCPFGIVGDRIWVRETWAILGNEDGCSVDWNDNLCRGDEKNAARIYRASCEQKPGDYGLWSICSCRKPKRAWRKKLRSILMTAVMLLFLTQRSRQLLTVIRGSLFFRASQRRSVKEATSERN